VDPVSDPLLLRLLQYSTEVEQASITVYCNIQLQSTSRNNHLLSPSHLTFTGLCNSTFVAFSYFYLKIALFQENGKKIPSIYTDFQDGIARSEAETLVPLNRGF
jgi:hypothetical protein